MTDTTTRRGAICLWFDDQAREAAEFYTRVLRDGVIGSDARYLDPDPSPAHRDGQEMTVEFTVEGIDFVALNGGPQFTFDEAISIQVFRDTQDEIDAICDALLEGGGVPGRCGWLKDRFGLSWQVVPAGMGTLLRAPDGSPSHAAMEAMLAMDKLDIDVLRAAAATG